MNADRLVCSVSRSVVRGVAYDPAALIAVAANSIEAEEHRPPSDAEVKALASELGEQLVRFVEDAERFLAVRWPEWKEGIDLASPAPMYTPPWPSRESDGVLWLDALAASFLEALNGRAAQDLATEIRRQSVERWSDFAARQRDLFALMGWAIGPVADEAGALRAIRRLWILWFDPLHHPVPVRFASILARALWTDVVRQRMDIALCPVLPGFVVPNLVGVLVRSSHVVDQSGALEVWDGRGKRRASLRAHDDAPQLPENIARAATVFHRLSTARLLRWAVHRGWSQRYVEGKRLYNQIEVAHGYSGLARAIGPDSRKHAAQLREGCEFLQHLFMRTPYGEGGMFNAYLHVARPGRPAILEINLTGPLRPGYVNDLNSPGIRSEDRALVPFPLTLPPLGPREADHAGQAALQVLSLLEFRRRADELNEAGMIHIPRRRWEQLADEAEVPACTLPDVLDRWVAGTSDAPPFLEREPGDRFTLAPAYARELSTLKGAGRRMRSGAVRGRQSARRRRG